VSLAAFLDAQDVICTQGLENVRYCRPEGGEGQPTNFFCAICSMTCWTHDKFGLTTVSLESLRNGHANSLAADLEPRFHCCYNQRVLEVSDAKDKYLDYPAFLSGSDVKIACVEARQGHVDDNQLDVDDNQLVLTNHQSP
jgi:hypothetical protein